MKVGYPALLSHSMWPMSLIGFLLHCRFNCFVTDDLWEAYLNFKDKYLFDAKG